MKAINTGEGITINASYEEMAHLVRLLEESRNTSPELLYKLHNPQPKPEIVWIDAG